MQIEVSVATGDRELLAVANTRHGIDAWRPLAPPTHLVARGSVERLRTAPDATAFLAAFGLVLPAGRPRSEQLLRLRHVRECVRALGEGDVRGYRRRLDTLLAGLDLTMTGSGAIETRRTDWDGFIDVLAVSLVTLWPRRTRLKICHNSACGWVFIDRTRNNSQVWCSEQICADRERMRRMRRRRR